MVKNVRLKKENKIKKSEKNAETRMAVYIYIYIVYCHLENKKAIEYRTVKLNRRIRDRTILKLGIKLFKKYYFNLNLDVISIDLSLFGYT